MIVHSMATREMSDLLKAGLLRMIDVTESVVSSEFEKDGVPFQDNWERDAWMEIRDRPGAYVGLESMYECMVRAAICRGLRADIGKVAHLGAFVDGLVAGYVGKCMQRHADSWRATLLM